MKGKHYEATKQQQPVGTFFATFSPCLDDSDISTLDEIDMLLREEIGGYLCDASGAPIKSFNLNEEF